MSRPKIRIRLVVLAASGVVLGGLMVTPPGQSTATNVAAQVRIHERRALEMVHIRHRHRSRAQVNQMIARDLMTRHGWTSERQFRCLARLWTRESHWNHRAHNGATGAHGIPQAMPGSKMASAGPNWRSNPRTQIKWGLRYIKGRYRTPCGAWNHFRATGWY